MTKRKLSKTMLYIITGIITVITLIPIWLAFVNATRSTNQILQGVSLLPGGHFIENYKGLIEKGFNLAGGFLTSAFIAGASTMLGVYFSALTAYGIKAYNFKHKDKVYNLILLLIMIPAQLSFIGFYKYMVMLGFVNTYIPLIIPTIAAPATVFFIKQYLDSVFSPSLLEAARIDGAKEFYIFNRIMFPLMKPALATTGIMTFVGTWNNFMMPYIILTEQEKYTLPMLVQLLKSDIYKTDYGAIYLGISLSLFPVILVFFMFSKQIVSGVTAGGVKG